MIQESKPFKHHSTKDWIFTLLFFLFSFEILPYLIQRTIFLLDWPALSALSMGWALNLVRLAILFLFFRPRLLPLLKPRFGLPFFLSLIAGVALGALSLLLSPEMAFNPSPALLILILLGSIQEELSFRGLFLPKEKSSSREVWALGILSALIFTLAHPQAQGVMLLWIFITGGLFFILGRVSKTLWAPIGAHILYNLSVYFGLILLGK